VIPDILVNLNDAEAQFRALVALGTLIIKSGRQRMELKVKVLENSAFTAKMHDLSSLSSNDVEVKRMDCAKQVQLQLR